MGRVGTERDRFYGFNQVALGKRLDGERKLNSTPRKLRFAQRRRERAAFAKDPLTGLLKGVYIAFKCGEGEITPEEAGVVAKELERRGVDMEDVRLEAQIRGRCLPTNQVVIPSHVLAKYNIPELPAHAV